MGYYKTIKGKKYDAELITLAEESVKGRGDGRISLEDAEKILAAVKDADDYTDVEKSTMEYIRDNFKFTKESDKWFRTQIRSWAATKGAETKKANAAKKKPAKPEVVKTEVTKTEVVAKKKAAKKKVAKKKTAKKKAA